MLKRSNDRKVTVGVANAFGLPSGRNYSCPGQTSVCEKVCYAGKLEQIYKGVSNVMISNYDQLVNASAGEMFVLLSDMIDEFRADATRKGKELSFRIHWDGDFFSRTYAMTWAAVIRTNSDISFWAYTRSFNNNVNVVDILSDIPNLSLYLSVDNDNLAYAKNVRKAFPSVKWAWLGQTMDSAKDFLKTELGKPGAACPENLKRIPLINENKIGACISCGICVDGKADVRFSIKKG